MGTTAKKTPTASKTTTGKTNGHARRKLESWIDQFVEATDNLHSPELFRKWCAISTLASALEQKVWLTTSSPIFPNIYVFLIGHPGTGKTRTIRTARAYLSTLPEFHLAPTSMTFASLVDAFVRAKRMIVRLPEGPLEYNAITIANDELGTFLHKYDKEMADGLSAFYDNDPYGHERRGGDIKIKIKSPSVNILCGSTPSNLMEVVPEGAWGQGFTSRTIMVFSDERIIGDDFAVVSRRLDENLSHDLGHINTINGEFKVTEDYRNLVNLWRQQGEAPQPNHPRLVHYNARRKVNLYKLSMISAIDKSDQLLLTREDFNRAIGWLHEAEAFMADIFKASVSGGDSVAMDECFHYISVAGTKGMNEQKIINFLRERVPAHSILRVLEVMEKSGLIRAVRIDPATHLRTFVAEKAHG